MLTKDNFKIGEPANSTMFSCMVYEQLVCKFPSKLALQIDNYLEITDFCCHLKLFILDRDHCKALAFKTYEKESGNYNRRN